MDPGTQLAISVGANLLGSLFNRRGGGGGGQGGQYAFDYMRNAGLGTDAYLQAIRRTQMTPQGLLSRAMPGMMAEVGMFEQTRPQHFASVMDYFHSLDPNNLGYGFRRGWADASASMQDDAMRQGAVLQGQGVASGLVGATLAGQNRMNQTQTSLLSALMDPMNHSQILGQRSQALQGLISPWTMQALGGGQQQRQRQPGLFDRLIAAAPAIISSYAQLRDAGKST